MARRINPSKIKKNLTYSMVEAAEDLGISVATVRNWVRQGLPICKGLRPYLIFGEDLRTFIATMQKARRFTLRDDELNCFTCKGGRPPLDGMVIYTPQTTHTGRLSGICGVCGGKCARLIGHAQLDALSAIFRIQRNGNRAP